MLGRAAVEYTQAHQRPPPCFHRHDGHHFVHPREIFRLAILTAASAVIALHNHPSGESTPSEADIKVTRDLIRAGQLLKMELIDHVIIGNDNFSSLRSLGYFYA